MDVILPFPPSVTNVRKTSSAGWRTWKSSRVPPRRGPFLLIHLKDNRILQDNR